MEELANYQKRNQKDNGMNLKLQNVHLEEDRLFSICTAPKK